MDLTVNQKLSNCVQNNATWCSIVCDSHGNAGQFNETTWVNTEKSPPFYPNLITLTAGQCDTQTFQIENLIEDKSANLARNWGVKDSFDSLNLSELGFRKIIRGSWIYRDEAPVIAEASPTPAVHWIKITQADELAAWEKAWRNEPADTAGPVDNPIMLTPLLANRHIAILAAIQDKQIVAGVIANQSDDVVGLSNIFLPEANEAYFRAACVTEVSKLFPNVAMVGYESGDDLTAMKTLGFEALGPLSIWIRDA